MNWLRCCVDARQGTGRGQVVSLLVRDSDPRLTSCLLPCPCSCPGSVWPRRKLLDSLRAALESRGPAMDERMRAHAAEALRVLEARLVRARERRVVFPRRRADWVAAVRKGLEAKAKAAAEQEAAKHVAAEAAAAAAAVAKAAVVGGAEAAEARVSRRGALKAGVLRRRKSRLTGAAADVAAGAPSA